MSTVYWSGRQASCCRPYEDSYPVHGGSQGVWLPMDKNVGIRQEKKVRKLRGKRENKYDVYFQHNSVESGIHCFLFNVILWFLFFWTWCKVLHDVYCTSFQEWRTEPCSMSEILENSPWFNFNSFYKQCPNLRKAQASQLLHFLLLFTLVVCLSSNRLAFISHMDFANTRGWSVCSANLRREVCQQSHPAKSWTSAGGSHLLLSPLWNVTTAGGWRTAGCPKESPASVPPSPSSSYIFFLLNSKSSSLFILCVN